MEQSRTLTRIAIDPLIAMRGWGLDKGVRIGEESFSTMEEEEERGRTNASDQVELFLIDGFVHENVNFLIKESLDEKCPALKSTPRLADKALRVVFSVGVDVVMLDATCSAAVGKLQLTESDLISSAESDIVFKKFGIVPKEKLEIIESMK